MEFEGPPELPVSGWIGAALFTALLGAFIGPLVFTILLVLIEPGDGGVSAAATAIIPFTFAGFIIAFPVGLTALLVVGWPVTRSARKLIVERPNLAVVTSLGVGFAIGVVVGLIMFGWDDFAFATIISGTAFGAIWMMVVRRMLWSARAGKW